jgi:hypothetical protein
LRGSWQWCGNGSGLPIQYHPLYCPFHSIPSHCFHRVAASVSPGDACGGDEAGTLQFFFARIPAAWKAISRESGLIQSFCHHHQHQSIPHGPGDSLRGVKIENSVEKHKSRRRVRLRDRRREGWRGRPRRVVLGLFSIFSWFLYHHHPTPNMATKLIL